MYGMIISLDNLTINIAKEPEQSSENGMYIHEDVHFRKKSYIQMDQEDNNLGVLGQEPVLEILCGMASGKLYLNKSRAGGRTKPVKVNDLWYSLAEFQSVIGKSKTRNWKKSVTYCGVPLGLQMDLLNGRRLMEEPQEDCEEPNLESHQMVDDLFEKVYFKLKSAKTNPPVRRGAGGLVVYVREELSRGIDFVHSQKMEDRAWLRLQKSTFNLTNDVYLSFFYIPPLGTTGTTSTSQKWHNIGKKKTSFA